MGAWVRDLLGRPLTMAYRFAFPLSAALVLGASVLACTETVIKHEAAPAVEQEAGPDPIITPPEPDAGPDVEVPPFEFKEAPPGTFAQAISAGGSVVKAGKLVPIIYTADNQKQAIIDFSAKIATSTYWGAISAEYGVGALTAKTPIILTETAPSTIDDQQIESWLKSRFSTDAARFGVPDSSTLYAIYYPAGTTVTQGGGQSCESFGGYHFETNVNGTPISYAVMPRCAAFAGLGGVDVTTFASSHEILEWATDPYPETSPAYMDVDRDHAVWSRVFLGELGDLCTQLGDVSTRPADLPFTVQRTWSNASAKAGHHPCAPTTKVPYFTAFPTKLDPITAYDNFGRQITTRGLKVAVGESKTIDITLYADGAMAAWDLQVIDITKIYGLPAEFSYKLSKPKGKPGDTLQLTITGEQQATQGQGFLIVSQSKNESNLFPVWVTN
jgi:hypothetical protein